MPKRGQPGPNPLPSIVSAGAGYLVDRVVATAAVLAISVMLFGGFLGWILLGWFRQDACPRAPAEIFVGITYGCERLVPSLEGSGPLHWVRIDLSAPGIELYVTPLDAEALAAGWQYRMRWISDVVRSERLAVAINGTLFASGAKWRPRIPGDFARGAETLVANHVVSHVWEHTYLLWFDDGLTPHLEMTKPPRREELAKAKWGIGGQGIGLRDGQVWAGLRTEPDSRTAVAIDGPRRLLFMAVGENISPRLILQKLAGFGARDGMLLDDGGSSTMAIGDHATGVPAGTPALAAGGRSRHISASGRNRCVSSP